MTTGTEILTSQRNHDRMVQRVLNEIRSRTAERLATMPCYTWGKPKLKIDLSTGNIFRDAFPFLFPFRYEYPEMPKGKDTIRIRMPIKYDVKVEIPKHNQQNILSSEAAGYVTKMTDLILDNPPNRPFFSTRLEIANKCEEWCKAKDIPADPLNIITAAFKLGLVKR